MNYIYIDCKIEDEISAFCAATANAEKIIEFISLFKGRQITEHTLLVFDEVQVSGNHYGYDAKQKLLTLPFYFFPFAAKDLAKGNMRHQAQ